jgi:hypothetical protein
MKTLIKLLLAQCMLALVLCGPLAADPEPIASDPAEASLASRTPVLIQPGHNQLLLGVTDDNYAVYQEGAKLYATALVKGAPRLEIAEVPNNNVAQILQVGTVALLWLDPERNLPGFGVSPLVIWSAASGARRISENSAVGLVATDAQSAGVQVLFTTNATPDGGLNGDLAITDAASGFRPRTLLRQIKLDFPFGQCRPVAAFIGPPGQAIPTAEYCAGTDTTATLSRWERGRRIDLLKNIATPLPFTLETNPQQTEFFVRLAGTGDPVVVTDQGRTRAVDRVAGTQGFVTDRGTAVYDAQPSSSTPLELRFAPRGRGPITVASPFAFVYAPSYNFSGYSKRPIASPDGRSALFASVADPLTGLADLQLLDLRSGAIRPIDSRPVSFAGFDVFTADSSRVLYFSNFNPNTGLRTLFSADRGGTSQQLSDDDTALLNLAATDSLVSFNDRVTINSAPLGTFALSHADLRIIDAARPERGARRVAEQVNLFYFPSHGRRGLVFTSDVAAAAGLYLAGARL